MEESFTMSHRSPRSPESQKHSDNFSINSPIMAGRRSNFTDDGSFPMSTFQGYSVEKAKYSPDQPIMGNNGDYKVQFTFNTSTQNLKDLDFKKVFGQDLKAISNGAAHIENLQDLSEKSKSKPMNDLTLDFEKMGGENSTPKPYKPVSPTIQKSSTSLRSRSQGPVVKEEVDTPASTDRSPRHIWENQFFSAEKKKNAQKITKRPKMLRKTLGQTIEQISSSKKRKNVKADYFLSSRFKPEYATVRGKLNHSSVR